MRKRVCFLRFYGIGACRTLILSGRLGYDPAVPFATETRVTILSLGMALTDNEDWEVKKEALLNLLGYLCDQLRAERHFDYLRSFRIISRSDTEEIGHKITSRCRAECLIDHVASHPKGFDTLMGSLQRDGTQPHVQQRLRNEYQRCYNAHVASKQAGGKAVSEFIHWPVVTHPEGECSIQPKLDTGCNNYRHSISMPDGQRSRSESIKLSKSWSPLQLSKANWSASDKHPTPGMSDGSTSPTRRIDSNAIAPQSMWGQATENEDGSAPQSLHSQVEVEKQPLGGITARVWPLGLGPNRLPRPGELGGPALPPELLLKMGATPYRK
uniref:B-cell lymphoma/leukemia 10 n=1 Tax=Myxine glutinosa TaxID=7769 RepID=UPI00358E5221